MTTGLTTGLNQEGTTGHSTMTTEEEPTEIKAVTTGKAETIMEDLPAVETTTGHKEADTIVHNNHPMVPETITMPARVLRKTVRQ